MSNGWGETLTWANLLGCERHFGAECAVVAAGEVSRFLAMLRLTEMLHLGTHATFGLGRVEVDVLV